MAKTEWFGAFFWLYFFNGLMINLGISVTSGIIWMVLVAAKKKVRVLYFKVTVSNYHTRKGGFKESGVSH